MAREETGLPTTAQPPGPAAASAAATRRRRRSHLAVLAVIAAGGALGAVTRYGASRLWPTDPGTFPWTTLTVNAVGCLVIGVFLVAVTEVFSVHPLLRPFFGTGVLGGFTTFSTYCVDIRSLLDEGHAATALTYLAATLVAALTAVSTGAWGARRLLAKWSER
ncbi:fluoride efflux transporter CrcB [Streptomyces griseus]|uniref:fluoride efflux transporter CrcB n=1 Tax=Streptomyces griseus TaxID=1911 RepID=UPI000D19FA73|nr:fluoride efflux transporter CrcB [Streptomyces griseus]